MVNAGRILILAQGEWDNLTNYVPLDLISKGETAYLARKASVGVDPETDVEMFYWQPFGSVAKIATTEIPGLVMPDGTTLTIDSTGLLKAEIGVSKLTDVLITNLANDSFLKYDAATQKWKNVTLGTASSKNSTNAVTQGSSDLVESGAVYAKYDELRIDVAKTYKTDDASETSLASNDLIPFYDTSATAKKKMTVADMVGQAVSNPNLLDNPWFTVNQRGQASYTNSGYTVDRWYNSYGASVITPNQNGINLSEYKWLIQPLNEEVYKSLNGKIVTASLLTSEGQLFTGTAQFVAGETTTVAVVRGGTGSENLFLRFHTFGGNNTPSFEIVNFAPGSATPINIRAVKLEKGPVSTLMMDTAPYYPIEIAKCKTSIADSSDTYANQDEIVTADANDNDWINDSFGTNTSISYIRKNNIVTVTIAWWDTGSNIHHNDVIYTLPAKYRPRVSVFGINAYVNQFSNIWIGSDGGIHVETDNQSGVVNYGRTTISYIVL